MATRPVKTPGATTAPVADQADLLKGSEADLTTATTASENTGDDQSSNETSSLGEPVEPTAEEIQAKKEYDEFLEWRKSKGIASEPVTPHVPASALSGEPVTKRTRQIVGPHGWTTEEY